MMKLPPDEVLDRAADRLDFEGRAIGVLHDTQGHGCLVATLAAVENFDLDTYLLEAPPASRALLEYLVGHPGVLDPETRTQAERFTSGSSGGWGPDFLLNVILTGWNDRTPVTSVITEHLRRCAKELREANP